MTELNEIQIQEFIDCNDYLPEGRFDADKAERVWVLINGKFMHPELHELYIDGNFYKIASGQPTHGITHWKSN